MVNSDAPSDPLSGQANSGLRPDSESGPDCFDIDQMLSLVDTILPFEACLYYQVLPLSLSSSHLNLGIVNPEDTAATDYVRRQLAYVNYSLATRQIPSNWHRDMLSHYLSHKAKTRAKTKPSPSAHSSSQAQSSNQPSSPLTATEQATFILDSSTSIPAEYYSVPTAAPDEQSASKPASQLNGSRQGQLRPTAKTTPAAAPKPSVAKPPSSNARQKERPQHLDLNLPVAKQPVSLDTLGNLPPKALTQALLKRVLQDGIGRLYFERRETRGRILWSKDGIVQAVLDDLPLPLFQSVINELKQLTHLPLITAQKTRQVEIERTYRQERVVLRFRLIASSHGEEATLQVLRGAALKFYQQQQIDQLGQDALTFAHRLQSQIDQIRDRARQTFTLEGVSETTLTTISHLLKDIDSEINQLIQRHNKQ